MFGNGQLHVYALPESSSGEIHQGLGQQAPEGLLRHGRLQVLPSATLAACRVDGVLACDRSGQLVFVSGVAVQACIEGAGMEAIGRLDSRGSGASLVSGYVVLLIGVCVCVRTPPQHLLITFLQL